MADIEIAVEPPKPLTVNLGGVSYKVRPIKTSLGMALAQAFGGSTGDRSVDDVQGQMEKILQVMFGATDAKKVQKRLDSDTDALDYPHIMELLKALIEKSSGNPTM